MADLALKTKALIGMIIGLLITVFGWFMISALSDIIENSSLKAIFWIGIILYWASAVLLLPLMMILGGRGNFKGAVSGLVAFMGGYVMSLILYYTIGYVIEAMDAIWANSTFVAIGWFAVYTLWILGLIIVPVGLTLKDAIMEGENGG